ncbi:MAG: CHAP domain-containing protein [Terracidiphilus sp.]|jgi:hypothetical protein
MITGPLDFTGPSNVAGQRVLQGGFAQAGAGEVNFQQMVEEALSLEDQQCSDPGDGLDADFDSSLQVAYDSSGLHVQDGGASFSQSVMGVGTGSTGAQYYGSSMARLLSQGSVGRGLPATVNAGAWLSGNPAMAPASQGSPASSADPACSLNKSKLSEWMDAHALTRSSHHCAMYCRMGLEAAGLNTADRPQSGDAGDYGPFLMRHGAQVVSPDSYTPQVGDVVVFDKTDQHPYGHIEMYDGSHWVSDFMQHSISPYRDAGTTPPFTIYRLA